MPRLNFGAKQKSEVQNFVLGDTQGDKNNNKMRVCLLTGIARLVHVNDLNLTTQILTFPCETCSVYATKQFGYPPKILRCLYLETAENLE